MGRSSNALEFCLKCSISIQLESTGFVATQLTYNKAFPGAGGCHLEYRNDLFVRRKPVVVLAKVFTNLRQIR